MHSLNKFYEAFMKFWHPSPILRHKAWPMLPKCPYLLSFIPSLPGSQHKQQALQAVDSGNSCTYASPLVSLFSNYLFSLCFSLFMKLLSQGQIWWSHATFSYEVVVWTKASNSLSATSQACSPLI